MTLASGTRITIRGEDFLVTDLKGNLESGYIIEAEGVSELVKGLRFHFDTNLDDFEVLHPANAGSFSFFNPTSSGFSALTAFFAKI